MLTKASSELHVCRPRPGFLCYLPAQELVSCPFDYREQDEQNLACCGAGAARWLCDCDQGALFRCDEPGRTEQGERREDRPGTDVVLIVEPRKEGRHWQARICGVFTLTCTKTRHGVWAIVSMAGKDVD